MGYVSEGKTNKELAVSFHLSLRAIENRLAEIYYKLDAKNRSEALSRFIKRRCKNQCVIEWLNSKRNSLLNNQ
ncbi:Bacterial regulatory protein, luxR family [compost metagenome]